jgi:hypothetical protein
MSHYDYEERSVKVIIDDCNNNEVVRFTEIPVGGSFYEQNT